MTLRGGFILVILLISFPLLLALRPVERFTFGVQRPFTPWITQTVCALCCAALGLRRHVFGRPTKAAALFASNHVSWLDIFVLNANHRVTFVAKSEVRAWRGIGWLARGTGTLFIDRRKGAARDQARQIAARIGRGDALLIFPEGTSTDGLRVLPFRSTVFAALFMPGMPPDLVVQPVTLSYHAPPGREARFFGWWGTASFRESLLEALAQAPQGWVEVTWHDPLPLAGQDRKSLARQAEEAVRAGLTLSGPPDPSGP